MGLLGVAAPGIAGLARLVRDRPSTGLLDLSSIPDSVLQVPRLAVLEMDPGDLDALLSHSQQRGRRWERPARIAFLSDGAVRFESHVGVRIHGGISRIADSRQRSFRLRFTESLGSSTPAGASIGFREARRHRTLVLHGDVRGQLGAEWHYVNPVAFELARRVGVHTAETTPITLVINGGKPLPYVLTEYLDLDFLETRFGHRDFTMFDTKSRTPEEIEAINPLTELYARAGAPENWTLERVAEVVDIDNLSRWFIASLYCGTRDMWQGKLVRDRSGPRAKWFWIAWDFDQSFGRPPAVPYPIPQPEPVWEDDQFALHLSVLRQRDERAVLLEHLFRTSEEYRRVFRELFHKVRAELLTEQFIDQVLTQYEQVAADHGIEDTQYQKRIRQWFANRPDIVRRQVQTYAQARP